MDNEVKDEMSAEIAPATEIESELLLIAQQIGSVYEQVFSVTHTEDWKTYTLKEQRLFRDVVQSFFVGACIVREKFDADVWKGHANGTVSSIIESIRKQRDGEKPGKKAEVPTAASLLAKRLSK